MKTHLSSHRCETCPTHSYTEIAYRDATKAVYYCRVCDSVSIQVLPVSRAGGENGKN
jgi:hypothetical protein